MEKRELICIGCPMGCPLTVTLDGGAVVTVQGNTCPRGDAYAVSAMADYIGSTTGIMKYAKESDAKEFIIGTENSIVQHLQYECPDKKFYPLSKDCVCHNMKLTTLMDVYNCVCGQGGEEIKLDENVRVKAKACIDTMLTMGE